MVAFNNPKVKRVSPLTGKKRGRPSRPYRTSYDGTEVHGLHRDKDGRWRIVATGERFSEADERTALDRFREWQQQKQVSRVLLPIQFDSEFARADELRRITTGEGTILFSLDYRNGELVGYNDTIAINVPERAIWAYVRKMLLLKPEYVAKHTGLPKLENFRDTSLPTASILLSALWKAFEKYAKVKKEVRRKMSAAWDEMLGITEAVTLADLTTEA